MFTLYALLQGFHSLGYEGRALRIACSPRGLITPPPYENQTYARYSTKIHKAVEELTCTRELRPAVRQVSYS